MPIELPVAFHPVVLYLFWKHGISVLDLPLWELYEYTTSDVFVTNIVSVEPFVADFTIALEDEILSLRMDDTATVTLNSCNQD
ncbi:hypothetical protein EGH23_22025 [Halomicroarcula sp. F27]|uniref:DUF7351 domain-containing protein n=2 Tax=Haloarcula nitratireducens TaxID=2487749 RepID=A0AAW4PJ26_9EURY|nr:hypothetical protein [Halomicroarcula nitratireducens]MBX0297558.1 hypothetical protein [Halomicroarcula nitratireducens]